MFDDMEEEETTSDDDSGMIVLRNGDRIDGQTLGIGEGSVRIKSPLGEFDLPIFRLRSIPLRTAAEAEDPVLTQMPILQDGDVRAHFTEGGHVTFKLLELDGNIAGGRSQTFGEARFDLSAFNRIEFNLYSGEYGLDE
jgi:hypothetical protein